MGYSPPVSPPDSGLPASGSGLLPSDSGGLVIAGSDGLLSSSPDELLPPPFRGGPADSTGGVGVGVGGVVSGGVFPLV